jgi:hypothetical protein
MNSILTLDLDRLQEIELEREQTKLDANYQKWVRELKVSRMYTDRTGILNAKDMLAQYDMLKLKAILS